MRILLIEDDSEIAEFIKLGLENETFAVDVAPDGDKGSYLARTNEYDLLILDNALPKKNGLSVCKEVREAGKSVPILVLSVQNATIQKVGLLDAGADDYLTKPFSFRELVSRIRALLRRPDRLEAAILSIHDLSLDVQRQAVTRNGKNIYLTRKEFSLLEFLLKNKGRVLSRGMILEHVWDIETDPFSNTVEAHILNLRKKLHVGKSQEIIHNVPGRGYIIDENR